MAAPLEYNMGSPVAVGGLQLVADVAIRGQRQPLLRHRGPGDVAAKPLQFVALVRLGRYPGVQRQISRKADLHSFAAQRVRHREVPNENPASLATRSEPGLSSSGGSVCNVPKVGALGEDFPALVRAHCNAVGDRPLLRIHALAALVIPFTSMALQLHHGIVIIGFQRQIAVPGNCSMRRLKRLLLVLYLLHPCSRRHHVRGTLFSA